MKIKPRIGFQSSLTSAMDANVDQNDQQSLARWCFILGVTKEELLMAIREHGNQIKNIRKGLRKKDDEAA